MAHLYAFVSPVQQVNTLSPAPGPDALEPQITATYVAQDGNTATTGQGELLQSPKARNPRKREQQPVISIQHLASANASASEPDRNVKVTVTLRSFNGEPAITTECFVLGMCNTTTAFGWNVDFVDL